MTTQIESVPFPFPPKAAFDEVIDVRAPSEFEEDHLSGAVNLPVLSDEERSRVGACYQVDRFEGRKLGAALVSANIANHLTAHFAGKARDYRPLIYCWRGGQRSRSLATVLAEIGWRVGLLQGGYKSYRRHVTQVLDTRAEALRLCIVNGLTGSGKTRLLRALEAQGGQVLNLEDLARHKGSVFGGDLSCPQPSQKRFESLIYDRLFAFSATRPVYLEAESPKIGQLYVPSPIWQVMRRSKVIELAADLPVRVAFLKEDYDLWIADPNRIRAALDLLHRFHPRDRLEQWKAWCAQGQWPVLIESLLLEHYDRRYGTSSESYFRPAEGRYALRDHSEEALACCAEAILRREDETG